jgi:hypothetical protein
MKMNRLGYALLLAVFVSGTAFADAHEEMERPSFHASQSMMVNAVVEAINHETREVRLRRSDGEIIEFVASEEARNLGQVDVGDVVNAEYVHSVSIEVVANDEGFEPDAGQAGAMARTKEGEMPGVAAINTQVATATVEEINIEANTFKLKGVDGTINEYTARNPDNLKRAKVGDLVVMTVTDAVAITVEEVASE